MQISKRVILALVAFILTALSVFAQEKEQSDSLVRLISAESLRQYKGDNGMTYRKVVGKARFLHNDTYLLCDTAVWNVDRGYIDAWGNVSILQEQTVLTSEKMKYIIEDNLAQFRGSLVQLEDKDKNTLRTKILDYNTKDSVAVFRGGASMKDKDGQIIESDDGRYDSKSQTFSFIANVNMFTDSMFVKTTLLIYEADKSLAKFGQKTNAWKDDNMFSAEAGWYDRLKELFFFNRNVHVLTKDQEAWSDSLYFYRNTMDIQMLGNAQLNDTTRNIYALAGNIAYVDSLSKVTFARKPAIISMIEEKGQKDTVYFGADTIRYFTQRMCDIDSLAVLAAETRLKNTAIDPVGEFRKKAAEAAAKAAEAAAMKDPSKRAQMMAKGGPSAKGPQQMPAAGERRQKPKAASKAADSLSTATDSTMIADSLSVPQDTIVVEKDTTKMGFLSAIRNVKIYRKDMQVLCDSLVYTDLDSLARLYKNPIIWNEITHQYVADSISIVVENNAMKQANLMSNAFIHIKEDAEHFDQIRGAEMIAYFGEDGQLNRFDALGGSTALFYIEENDSFATVNKKESKMLSAHFNKGNIEKIYYFEAPKSDGYPVVQMAKEDKELKGFSWQPDKRPADRYAVTSLVLRPGERTAYEARPHAEYLQTDIYFPGYIESVYKEIKQRDSLNLVRKAERERLRELERMNAEHIKDSLKQVAVRDSLAALDSIRLSKDLKKDEVVKDVKKDSSSLQTTVDSVQVKSVLTKEEIKAKKKKKRETAKLAKEEARLAKEKARELRWKELDQRDAEKLMKKAEKKAAKLRKKKLKALRNAEKQAQRDAALLEKYKQKLKEKNNKSK
jgi:hypothetical protein